MMLQSYQAVEGRVVMNTFSTGQFHAQRQASCTHMQYVQSLSSVHPFAGEVGRMCSCITDTAAIRTTVGWQLPLVQQKAGSCMTSAGACHQQVACQQCLVVDTHSDAI